MSSLLEALRSERERVRIPSCLICSWLSEQEGDVIDEINTWVEEGLKVKPLWQLLVDNGMPGSDTTFRNHLRACP